MQLQSNLLIRWRHISTAQWEIVLTPAVNLFLPETHIFIFCRVCHHPVQMNCKLWSIFDYPTQERLWSCRQSELSDIIFCFIPRAYYYSIQGKAQFMTRTSNFLHSVYTYLLISLKIHTSLIRKIHLADENILEQVHPRLFSHAGLIPLVLEQVMCKYYLIKLPGKVVWRRQVPAMNLQFSIICRYSRMEKAIISIRY